MIHEITVDDAEAWLQQYGLDITDIREINIEMGRHPKYTKRLVAIFHAVIYVRDENGRHAAMGPGVAATKSISFPLTSFPVLTPVKPST